MDDCYFKGFHPGFLPADTEITVVDIGANLGFFSLYVRSRYPACRVFSVEPLQQNYDWMVDNFEANPGCSLFPRRLALSDRRGTIRISSGIDEPFPTGASVLNTGKTGSGGTTYEVPALPLADFLADEGIGRVDFLKCDCEGAEYAVFYSCPATVFDCVQHIAMEVHQGEGERESIDAMVSFLADRGYACCMSEDRHFVWASRDPDALRERTA
jgi:FkbM family methyltransferase